MPGPYETPTAPASVEHVAPTYDPRYVDPNPETGGFVFVGEIVGRYADGSFDFLPSYSSDPSDVWTVCAGEVKRGLVAVDPKQVG